jgi:glycosyltransferase involved in cell wall biosynthesis
MSHFSGDRPIPRVETLLHRLQGLTPLHAAELRLSVLVPVYNERETVEFLIEHVRSVPVRTEIVCVDDCSTDGTSEILARLHAAGRIDQLIRHTKNKGKGAAIRAALAASTGNVVIVQDADLEYDPADWPALLQPIIDGKADAVFGSRFLGGPHRVLYFWHSVGNRVLTTLSNMFTNLNLTDMETCYKAVRGDLARSLVLTSDRFGFEPEITARLAQADARIYEVPISYSGRTYAEGKKIGWKDGVAAIGHILRYNLVRPASLAAAPARPPSRHAAVPQEALTRGAASGARDGVAYDARQSEGASSVR